MHQIRFPLRLHHRPRWGAYSALQALAVFEAPTSKESERKGRGVEGSREGKVRMREVKGWRFALLQFGTLDPTGEKGRVGEGQGGAWGTLVFFHYKH